MQADLERTKRKLEKEKEELERSKWEKEEKKREYEAWLQSETVEMPMFPPLEGPEQSAPTTVALAAEVPAAEVMTDTGAFPDTDAPDASVERVTDTRVFPDTAAPDASVERAASKSSSNGSNSNSSSSSNDTTSNHDSWWGATYVGALLRPFDPRKGCQREARRGKGESWGRMQHGG